MTTRCTPGDLAVVIGGSHLGAGEHIGAIVRCVALSAGKDATDDWLPGWRTHPALRNDVGREIVWHDSHLQPIRGPGVVSDVDQRITVEA